MTNTLSRWWKRIWCAMDGHGGIAPRRLKPEDTHWFCKRCGAEVKL
jgi:hypothetical protein